MMLLSPFRFEAFLLSCYFGVSFPRSCQADQQPSLRGTVSSAVSGNDKYFQDMILSHPQKLRRREEETNNTLFIAGLFDTNNFDWIEIFNFTMTLIQAKNGWHDDILGDEDIKLEWAVADSKCDEATGLQAYWDMKTAHVLHGVVGTRCSDSSIAVARITGLEDVPQVSPSATASTLSDKSEFPYFSRLVAPTQIQALVSTLRWFGWSRVSIIGTETQYASDQVNLFSTLWVGDHDDESGAWTGEIAYQHSVTLDTSGGDRDGSVIEDSVHQALNGVPTDDPSINSRVILLIAHDNHAFEILRISNDIKFQQDSIWVGLPGWGGRMPQDPSFIPPLPGYIGISEYRNRNSYYQDFLDRLLASNGQLPYDDLPDYTAEYMVDSIVALVMALVRTPQDQRRDGGKVTSILRNLEFEGVSGPVRFNADGDRDDAKYSILNLQYNNGMYEWTNVGTTGVTVGSTAVQQEKLCFAEFGCDIESIPSDKYPEKKQIWAAVIMSLLACLLVVVGGLYWRTQRKRTLLKEKTKRMAKQLEQQMRGMVEIVSDLPIQSPVSYQEKVEGSLGHTNVAVVWYWEEDSLYINSHNSSMVLTGTNFVSYSREVSGQLEHAFQLWKENKGFANFRVDLTGKVTSSTTNNKVASSQTGSHYEVNFEEPLFQKNSKSNYKRTVRREEVNLRSDAAAANTVLPPLPRDIEFSGDNAESLLPVFSGQIIQVSKAHPGNEWLFGTVLYDPLLEEALKQSQGTGSGGLGAVLANALHDRPTTGWFPKILSETADVNAMTTLLDNLGGEGAVALKPPTTWDVSKEGCVDVPKSSTEYDQVVDFFMAALYGQRSKVKVQKVERLQNVALWQSYALKKQSMKTRDTKNPDHRVNNRDASAIERKWLFHGTTTDVVPKITKQGFNRAFAGRNAVAYGKGVYFARDACYSSHKAYSEPDSKGIQRMFLCRVAVGDWCTGTNGQLTPDPKPHNHLELFDSTVDNHQNPSIFVVYHDAQAYPEYLVSFVST